MTPSDEHKQSGAADGSTVMLANLRSVAQIEYANTDGSVWLAAGPHTGDGLRVNRCNQHDPAAGTIRDGVFWLPIGCARALGGVNLRGGERYKLIAFSLADNAELERFNVCPAGWRGPRCGAPCLDEGDNCQRSYNDLGGRPVFFSIH